MPRSPSASHPSSPFVMAPSSGPIFSSPVKAYADFSTTDTSSSDDDLAPVHVARSGSWVGGPVGPSSGGAAAGQSASPVDAGARTRTRTISNGGGPVPRTVAARFNGHARQNSHGSTSNLSRGRRANTLDHPQRGDGGHYAADEPDLYDQDRVLAGSALGLSPGYASSDLTFSRPDSVGSSSSKRRLPPASPSAGLTFSPLNRPSSAVTAPHAPTPRPPSTGPVGAGGIKPGSSAADAATQRRVAGRRAGEAAQWENGNGYLVDEQVGEGARGSGSSWSRDRKGKERETASALPHTYEPPAPSNDPLDPLSSLHFRASPLPKPPTPARPPHPGHDPSLSASGLGLSIPRPSAPPPLALEPPDPPPPAARNGGTVLFPPSPSSRAHAPYGSASTDSLRSSDFPSGSSAASGPSSSISSPLNSNSHQPSLQQLLQTVDLNAALKLVQTLQQQQQQQQKATAPTTAAELPGTPSAYAPIEPVHPQQPTSNGLTATATAPNLTLSTFSTATPGPATSPIERDMLSAGTTTTHPLSSARSASFVPQQPYQHQQQLPTPLTPSSSFVFPPAAPISPSPRADSPTDPTAPPSASSVKKEHPSRRLSLMGKSVSMNMGLSGMGKRLRTASAGSTGPTGPVGLSSPQERTPLKERVPDERALLGEAGRSFEEQISRVHLTLSPATLRRAQNCAKYLSLRYAPVYAALASQQPPSSSSSERADGANSVPIAIPNLLDVSRWRLARDEAERRNRRAKVGPSGRFKAFGGALAGAASTSASKEEVVADGGEGGAGGGGSGRRASGVKMTPYGPRRNKHPKVWEVYPEEIGEFVAAGGAATAAKEKETGRKLAAGEGDGKEKEKQGETELAGESEGGRKQGAAGTSIDQLFRVTTSGCGTPSTKGVSGRSTSTPAKTPSDAHVALPSSPANEHGRASPHLRSASLALEKPPARPSSGPREPSYEGSLFGRSGASTGGSEIYIGSPLHRSTSLTAAVPPSSPNSGLYGSLDSHSSRQPHARSPRSRLASLRGSKDDLLPEEDAVGPMSTSTGPRHRHSTSEGLRSGLTRRLDKLRGKITDEEARAAGPGRRGSDAMAELGASALSSDAESHLLRSPSRRFNTPLPFARSALNLTSLSGDNTGSDTASRRPHLRKNAASVDLGRPAHQVGTGFESDGVMRSSGDEGGMSTSWRKTGKGLLAGAWQGFKGALDAYPDPYSQPPYGSASGRAQMGMGMRQARMEEMTRRKILEEESEDEERQRPQREVLDLGDEDFAHYNIILRQLRTDLSHLDSFLPHLPSTLNNFLDELHEHEHLTMQELAISVEYSVPRLPAAVLALLAEVKEHERHSVTHTEDEDEDDSGSESDTEESESSSSAFSSSFSSSSRRSASERAHPSHPPQHQHPGITRTRYAPVRRNSDRSSIVRFQSRRVTDPTSRKVQTRLRSQTVAVPPGQTSGVFLPLSPGSQRGGSGFAAKPLGEIQHADPLLVLERAVEELEKATRELDEEAKRLVGAQEDVDAEIGGVVGGVDGVQRGIDATNFQQLRILEDHYFRLRTALARPSSSIDVLWTGLSYALTVLFWLSWLAVTVFRLAKTIVALPVVVLRWLLFLR
ncbi:hypothetical protein JCM5296_003034 [Sporobolomyces johnsonii]